MEKEVIDMYRHGWTVQGIAVQLHLPEDLVASIIISAGYDI